MKGFIGNIEGVCTENFIRRVNGMVRICGRDS